MASQDFDHGRRSPYSTYLRDTPLFQLLLLLLLLLGPGQTQPSRDNLLMGHVQTVHGQHSVCRLACRKKVEGESEDFNTWL